MSFGYLHPQGLGFTTGDTIATQALLYSSGQVRYVDSENAQADDSGTGVDELRPWATLAYALANVTEGDIVVLGAAHEETMTADSVCAIDKVSVLGCASAGGEPTATLTFTTGSLHFSGNDVTVGNVKLVSAADLSAGYMLRVSGDRFLGRGILVEMGAGMINTFGINFGGATSKRIERCTMRSTAAVGAQLPLQGMYCNSTDCRIDIIDCVVDAGAAGFDYTGIEIDGSITKMLNIENLTQLRGADVIVGASCLGRIGVSSATGAARIAISGG